MLRSEQTRLSKAMGKIIVTQINDTTRMSFGRYGATVIVWNISLEDLYQMIFVQISEF